MIQESVPLVIHDPQYTGILDKMKYGNPLRQNRLILPQKSGWPPADQETSVSREVDVPHSSAEHPETPAAPRELEPWE